MKQVFAVAVLVVAGLGQVQAQDMKGSADHPLLPRYDGSEIRGYSVQAFDDYTLFAGKAVVRAGSPAIASENPVQLEGKVTHLFYRAPENRAVLEVFRNYEEAIASAGFEVLFSCSRQECGPRFNNAMNPGPRYDGLLYGDQQRYLAARLSRPEGDAYVSLYVTSFEPSKRTFVKLDVVEVKPMESRMVVLDAKALQNDIASEGRVAVYGVLFDFDKDTITSESKPQLGEIAKLLTASPELKVMIVGHTDAKGSAEYNQDLSARRARSVVNALTRDFGIAAGRLTPVGVGMAAPVASNRTDEGRAKNRRVELVDTAS